MNKKLLIIATIGPSSMDKSGVDIFFRINLSHTEAKDFK